MPLLFSFSQILTLSSPHCTLFRDFLLPQTLWQMWQELFSLFSFTVRLQWVPGHLFLLDDDMNDELAGRFGLLLFVAVPYSLSLTSVVVATRPLPRNGAWRKTMEPQKLGNFPGPGPKVVERQRVAKKRSALRVRSWTVHNQTKGVLTGVHRHCKKNSRFC